MKATIPILMLYFGFGPAHLTASEALAGPGTPVTKSDSVPGDDAESLLRQGRACLHGDGVPKNLPKAFQLFSAAAEKGNADAMGGVGYFHSNGVVVAKDAAKAAEWFRKGAEKGSSKSRLNLGKVMLAALPHGELDTADLAKRDEALRWIRMAADQNLPEAAFDFGKIHYFGDHQISKDYKLAAAYLKLAADAGIADAQNMMGAIHQAGSGTPIDDKKAEYWYRKAALQGHARAQSNLGQVLGPAVEDRNTRIEALAWLMLAMDQDDVTAKKTLRDTLPALKSGEAQEARKRATALKLTISKP